MSIYTLDFETFYTKEYSLSKMSSEAYIRSPLFEAICLSMKKDDEPTTLIDQPDIARVLSETDFSQSAILVHNGLFDPAILAWRYNVNPKLWLDTLSMARPFNGQKTGVSLAALQKEYLPMLAPKGNGTVAALGKRRYDFTDREIMEYFQYCKHDCALTYSLFRVLMEKFPREELLVIDRTIRMFTQPKFVLDRRRLEMHLESVKAKKEALLNEIGDIGGRDVLMSNPKFAEVLRGLGVEPPMKISKTTGQPTYAFAKTDKGMAELLEHDDLKIQALAAARLGVKSTLEETRTQALIEISQRGLLPIPLNYWAAITGRYSGAGGINVQNFGRGGEIRKSLCAPAGHKVIVSDLSQIEARMLAFVAGQVDLLQAFAEGRDVYSEFASDIYGRTITKLDKEERFVGKTAILGLGYGCGPERFREMLASGAGGPKVFISLEEARRIVQIYRNKNWKINNLWTRMGNTLGYMASGQSGVLIDTIDVCYNCNTIGLRGALPIEYPELKSESDGYMYMSRKKPTKLYGAKAVENIIQYLARKAITEMKLSISRKYGCVLQVHDELVTIVRDAEVDEAKAFIEKIMSTPPVWAPTLPVACEVGVGSNYGEAK